MNNLLNDISLTKIRMATIPDTQFMFALCCMLETKITDELPTAGTDGKYLYINPNFWQNLTKDEKVFLLAHETLHVAYNHMSRSKTYDKQKYNAAADYVINLFLVNRGFKMILGGLLDSQYHGMSTEEVYKLLPDTPNNPYDGDILSDNLSEEEISEIEQRIIASAHSAEMACATESIPSEIKCYLENLRKPKINWKAVLKRFMQNTGKADYSWRKPNRRLLSQGFYLPSVVSYGLSKVTFAIDVSGSINQDMFEQFINEVQNVFIQLNPNEIEVIQFHHNIADISLVSSLTGFKKINYKETGGTNIRPVMEYFKTTNSKALIVITDGYFKINFNNPRKPVLWAVFNHSDFKQPFGTLLHFQTET